MGSALLPILWLMAIGPQADEAAVTRGRHFYRTGTPVDQQRVQALMGTPPTAVPASVLPCINCHGPRGYGRPEGGMLPADITWNVLTRPYHLQTESGRRRPAYSEASLIRAIIEGIDSAGNRLDPNMPRYRLDDEQAADLVAWLRSMAAEQDPGITETSLRIGLLGPPATSSVRQDAEKAWQAFAANLTEQGGIYGRHLNLQSLSLRGSPAEDTAALRAFVTDQTPFMLVMLGQTSVPPHIAAFAHDQGIPLLGGRSLALPELHREVFYLYPSIGTHGRMMADYVNRTQGADVAVILTRPGFEQGAEAIVDGCSQSGWLTSPEIIVLDPHRDFEARLARVVALKPKYLFNMGLFDREVGQLASLLTKAGQQCTVLSPESLTTPAWLAASPAWKSLLVTSAHHARDLHKGTTLYNTLVRAHQLAPLPNPSRLASLAAAVLLRDTLLACGREVSREAVIRHFESTFRFETGFAPALSFSPNRRVGAERLYLHRYDHEQQTAHFLDTLTRAHGRDGL